MGIQNERAVESGRFLPSFLKIFDARWCHPERVVCDASVKMKPKPQKKPQEAGDRNIEH